jgi:hypothetical protein
MIAVPVEGYNFAAAAATTSSTQSGTGTGSASPSASTSNAPSSGLSTGAKAGIGAGIGGAVLLAAALGAFWFFSRKKYQAAPTAEPPGHLPNGNGAVGHPQNGYAGMTEYYKPAPQPPVEAEAKPVMHEMGVSGARPIEMYA